MQAMQDAPISGQHSAEAARKFSISSTRISVTHAIDDFLLDLMTLAFIVECYGRGFDLLARTLARRRLAKVRLLSEGVDSARNLYRAPSM